MKHTIIIIDDAPQTLEYLEMLLKDKGYAVLKATNGADALSQMETTKPDLIITDILMPEMDGFVFIKKIKENPRIKAIPVLVLTARGQMEDAFMALGVDDFITKPFDPETFLQKVRNLAGPAEKVDLSESEWRGMNEKMVLLAGRKKSILDKMRDLLAKDNFESEFCFKGEEVLSLAKRIQPRVVVIDANMFGAASPDIISSLTSCPETRKIEIAVYYVLEEGDLLDPRVDANREIQELAQDCLAAGAVLNLGVFEESSFLAGLGSLLKRSN